MTARQKKMLLRIIVSGVLFLPLFLLELMGIDEKITIPFLFEALTLIPYLIAGYDVLWKAIRGIIHGQVFDESFLMMVATVAAFFVGECVEAVAVLLFYQVGELFQSYAVGRSRESIKSLMELVPEEVHLEQDGEIVTIDPDEAEPESVIVVYPGERIPLDGVVLEGESFLDTAALTGESVPRKAEAGEEVISGCLNGEGVLRIRVTKAFEDSTVSKILELVENASSRKAKSEQFITRFARIYTPAVTLSALLLAIIPSLLTGDWGTWILRACIFLVISCPCALVISVPMSFFGGLGAASRKGVLIKGSNYLEAIAHAETIVFDKTGTLTKGTFTVTELYPEGISKEELLEIAALGEGYSNHPIARSIRAAYACDPDLSRVTNVTEHAGEGISALIDGRPITLGNRKRMEAVGITVSDEHPGTVVYLAEGNRFLGAVVISDTVKDGVREALTTLKETGVRKTVLLTGDRKRAAEELQQALPLDEIHADLLPTGKVEEVEKLLSGNSAPLAFVGDGINDAPVLMRADVGIAMGSMGSDAAIEAADIVIMDDDLGKIPLVRKIARKTMTIVRENVAFALGVKFLILALGALGLANMWLAVFSDVGVAVLAILNSMRTLKDR